MLRLAAFRPSSEKIVRLQLHPTYPWVVTADESANIVVWDWEHRQLIYEFNAIGVDERRLAGAQLQGELEPKISKLSQAIKDIKGGSVKHVKFYDDDVRYWQGWLTRAAISQSVTQEGIPPGGYQPSGPGLSSIRGRHFLVICCDSKAIFLDLVSMRAKDIPKVVFDNKTPLCVEFLPRTGSSEGPLAAFGGPDGVIRVLSITSWLVTQRFVGAHKGPVACLKTFLAINGETVLVSGGNDGVLSFWGADNGREAAPKLTVKGHDGGVTGIETIRVQGAPPQLVTIGADKTLAIWDTQSLKELRRMKPIPKVACNSVATWSHPRAPNLSVLTCVKDSNIWAVEPHVGGVTRPLCDLTLMVPPSQLPAGKKLKAYCLAVHPLLPHLVATGTNLGVILSEFDSRAVPAVVALPSPLGSKEHRVVCKIERELRLLQFQLASHINPTVINAGDTGARFRADSPAEAPHLLVKQTRSRVGPVANDSSALLASSPSGKYISVVWPELPAYEIYRANDWQRLDEGVAKHFAWDSCKERYALLQTIVAPKHVPVGKHGSSRKAREAAAAHAAAVAATAERAAAAAKVEVRILLDDGSSNLLTKAIEGRSEPVIGLQGGALLGVAYKLPRRMIMTNPGTAQGGGSSPLHGAFHSEDTSSGRPIGESPANFQFYSWETFRPVSAMLPQPEWTAWDQTVEYCALAYHRYVVISSLRPQYRYLGNVAIGSATGGVWHRRQLFLATPTTIECVFVDAGVSAVDLERKKRKDDQKARSAQVRAVAEQGELALLTVDAPPPSHAEKIALRPPMLQVVRLSSFQVGPSILKQLKVEGEIPGMLRELEERRGTEVAIGGGGVSVAVSRLPQEQKRPVGPLVVVGVRDGVLWLVDMFMTAHAIGLSHPGIRCRCLAAYGDAVSAVKWASRLGREHHDDLAQFMLGMGYASEALHLPGISKRLEFDLAMQSGDLKRALQSLITLSNSKGFSQDVDLSKDSTGIMAVSAGQPETTKPEAVLGIVKFAREFLELIDAADATAQGDIARQALIRLAAAGAVEGGLNSDELRALSFRLASHGELTRLAVQTNRMITVGLGEEAALAGAFLGDPNVLEKAWQDTSMFAQAALHAHAHGRTTLKGLIQQWNKVLQRQYAPNASKTAPELGQAIDPVLAALEAGLPAGLTPPKDGPGILQVLSQPRQPLIEIVPPGNVPSSTILALTTPPPKSGGPLLALPAPPGMPGGPMVPVAVPLPTTSTMSQSMVTSQPLTTNPTVLPETAASGVLAPVVGAQTPPVVNVVGEPPKASGTPEAVIAPPVSWSAADLQELVPTSKAVITASPAQFFPTSNAPNVPDVGDFFATSNTVGAPGMSHLALVPVSASSSAHDLDQLISITEPKALQVISQPPPTAPSGQHFLPTPDLRQQAAQAGFASFPPPNSFPPSFPSTGSITSGVAQTSQFSKVKQQNGPKLFPFPMSTSRSAGGARGFPLPMSTSTNMAGTPTSEQQPPPPPSYSSATSTAGPQIQPPLL